jgi:hypothetical protein
MDGSPNILFVIIRPNVEIIKIFFPEEWWDKMD